jgi:cytoskeletal protein CcmA (bactofilin family)
MAELDQTEAPQKQTTVEEGTQFRGTLQSSCQVLVRGVVEGELSAPSVVISESGSVVGNVKAHSIRSEGVLAGQVDAEDIVLSGSVSSDTVIRARTLEVKLQSVDGKKLELSFGECILEVGDDPSADVAEAAQPARAGAKKARRAESSQEADKSAPPA